MSFRERIIDLLVEAGIVVRPWGQVGPGRFHMVRPAGVAAGDRALVEVWCVNPRASAQDDPDDGLEEYMTATYRLLRPHAINPEVAPAEYVVNPNTRGANAHPALVITVSSPAPI